MLRTTAVYTKHMHRADVKQSNGSSTVKHKGKLPALSVFTEAPFKLQVVCCCGVHVVYC